MPLQHYNSTLALQHLHAFADAIVFRGNEDLLDGTRSASASRARAEQRHEPSRAGSIGGSRDGTRPHPRAGSSGRAGSVAGAEGRVTIADMNASFSLDLASYFFPRSLPLLSAADHLPSRGGLRPYPRPTCGRPRSEGGVGVTAPRNFDGGSLVASACPIASAKFVDLRSTLPLVGARATSATAPGWAELAGALTRAAPLCPRMGGRQTRDACVAAHHVLRGLGPSTGTRTVAPRAASRDHREKKGEGREPSDHVDAAAASASTEAGNVIRKHTGCPEWRTATDVSFSPGSDQTRVGSRDIPSAVTWVSMVMVSVWHRGFQPRSTHHRPDHEKAAGVWAMFLGYSGPRHTRMSVVVPPAAEQGLVHTRDFGRIGGEYIQASLYRCAFPHFDTSPPGASRSILLAKTSWRLPIT